MTDQTLFEKYTGFVAGTAEKAWHFASPVLTPAWDAWQSWSADLGARIDQPWQVVMGASVVAVLIIWRIIGRSVQNIVGAALCLGILAGLVTLVVAILSAMVSWMDAHPVLTVLAMLLAIGAGALAWASHVSEDAWEDVLVPTGAAIATGAVAVWALVELAANKVVEKVAGRFTRRGRDAAVDQERAAEVATLHEMFKTPPHQSSPNGS